MITKLKSVLNNTKLWQVLTTAILSYLGYSEVQDRMPSHDIEVEVVVPSQPQQHSHKNWSKDISNAVEASMDAHTEKFH